MMKTQFERNAGIALITGSLLLIVTMALHPVGGSIAHLLKITRVIIVSHSIALLALPFCLVGFWGLTRRIGTDNFFSITAFSVIAFGLVAVMGAAAVNGLALPVYLQNYKEADAATIESIIPLLRYNTALNHAFDFIYIGAVCISTLLWSIAIIITKRLPRWTAYLGILLSLALIVMLASGFAFTNLYGFRIFVISYVVWTLAIGSLLMRIPEESLVQAPLVK
jgi:hypothetical protein